MTLRCLLCRAFHRADPMFCGGKLYTCRTCGREYPNPAAAAQIDGVYPVVGASVRVAGKIVEIKRKRRKALIPYASNTGTRRNLQALRDHQWRILLTPDNPTPRAGLRHGIDNGAWGAFQKQQPFDGDAFKGLVERHGGAADFVVVPDIVAGGMRSLDFSRSWLPYLKSLRNLLLPVQDGMDVLAVGSLLSSWSGLGIFLGGTTEYKLRTMYGWGMVAHSRCRWYHVGRVNTVRRIRLAHEAGADSFDGTSATMYSCNLPMLDAARNQGSLLTPSSNVVQWSATT